MIQSSMRLACRTESNCVFPPFHGIDLLYLVVASIVARLLYMYTTNPRHAPLFVLLCIPDREDDYIIHMAGTTDLFSMLLQ